MSKIDEQKLLSTMLELHQDGIGYVDLFKKQTDRIALFQTDLDLLKKRYHAKKSLISQAADWYNEQAIWKQIAFITLGVAAILLLGLLTSMFISYGLLLIGGGMVYLFKEHHDTEQLRAEEFCNDILRTEQNMQEHVKSLNDIETKLRQLFDVFADKNQEYQTHISTLNDNIKILEDQAKAFQNSIDELQKLNESIRAGTEKISASSQEVIMQLSELCTKYNNAEKGKVIVDLIVKLQQALELNLKQQLESSKQENQEGPTESRLSTQTMETDAMLQKSKDVLERSKRILNQTQSTAALVGKDNKSNYTPATFANNTQTNNPNSATDISIPTF